MNVSKRLLILVCLFLVSACSHEQKVKDSQLSLMKATNPSPITTDTGKTLGRAEDIKKEVSAFPEIYDVAVIKGKKETLVVYKVKHAQRYRMKQIEKDLSKKLKKQYPKENIIVSSDYKIFLEAVRLNERIRTDKDFSKKRAEKRLQQIITMTKDMT
jgi:hypothetical protein